MKLRCHSIQEPATLLRTEKTCPGRCRRQALRPRLASETCTFD